MHTELVSAGTGLSVYYAKTEAMGLSLHRYVLSAVCGEAKANITGLGRVLVLFWSTLECLSWLFRCIRKAQVAVELHSSESE